MAKEYLRVSIPRMNALLATPKQGPVLPPRQPTEVAVEKNGKVLRCLFDGTTRIVAVTPKDSSLFPPLAQPSAQP
jgi:hypothetical protein